MKHRRIAAATVLLAITLVLGGCASTAPFAPQADGTPAQTQAQTSSKDLIPAQTASLPSSLPVAQVTLPKDLWERIRRGFAMPDLQSDLVLEREQWMAARPEYLARMSERGSKYMFHIVEELERRQMPTELALLPFIESAFNPQAVSTAKAAGMWQFIPSTGKHFELQQNVFRDDRRDVLASTRAALDYLQKLYGMFGDWHLALAAYNWGEGSVGRAIAKNQRAGLGTAYTDLNMPNETRQYVPRLQAMKNLVARPEAFKTVLPNIPNHPHFQAVSITRDIDVALAAKLAEVRLEDFKALNPSANRPVILAAGTPHILLPWDNAEIFDRNYVAYTGQAGGNAGQLASWTAWVAPANAKPADVAKRFGVSEAEFRAVNQIPPKVTIQAGSALLVPRAQNTVDDVTSQVADKGQLHLVAEPVVRRTVVKAGKHDTVLTLARRYKINAADVATWNRIGVATAFKAGQSVVVFLPLAAKSTGKTLTNNKPVIKPQLRTAAKGLPSKDAVVKVSKK
jgi:membrane-bound lytic murein transglycosylase D